MKRVWLCVAKEIYKSSWEKLNFLGFINEINDLGNFIIFQFQKNVDDGMKNRFLSVFQINLYTFSQ
jgi:hypothetical protein